jgi:hypothetical protein
MTRHQTLVSAVRELRVLRRLERRGRLAGAQRKRVLRLNRRLRRARPEERRAARRAA